MPKGVFADPEFSAITKGKKAKNPDEQHHQFSEVVEEKKPDEKNNGHQFAEVVEEKKPPSAKGKKPKNLDEQHHQFAEVVEEKKPVSAKGKKPKNPDEQYHQFAEVFEEKKPDEKNNGYQFAGVVEEKKPDEKNNGHQFAEVVEEKKPLTAKGKKPKNLDEQHHQFAEVVEEKKPVSAKGKKPKNPDEQHHQFAEVFEEKKPDEKNNGHQFAEVVEEKKPDEKSNGHLPAEIEKDRGKPAEEKFIDYTIPDEKYHRFLAQGIMKHDAPSDDEGEGENKPSDDEGDDIIFYEADSDSDEDLMEYYKVIESGYHPSITLFDDEEDTKRKCLDVPFCHNDQHNVAFKGKSFFELYKVKIKFNDILKGNTPLIGARLYGEIVTNVDDMLDWDNPFPIFYYTSGPDQPHTINLDSQNQRSTLLPLSGPPVKDNRPPMCEDYTFGLNFNFKLEGDGSGGENTFLLTGLLGFCPSNFGSSRGAFVSKREIGEAYIDRILMRAYYSVSVGAWATVKVNVLKKSVGSFHGVIMARPCTHLTRIRLLEIKDTEKGHEVDRETGGSIKLMRSVVVVPAYASLIIGAALYDHESGEVICRGRNYFPAQESGSKTKRISYNGVETVEVTVEWNC